MSKQKALLPTFSVGAFANRIFIDTKLMEDYDREWASRMDKLADCFDEMLRKGAQGWQVLDDITHGRKPYIINGYRILSVKEDT